jgi:excisionase family DNA binding protein
VDTERMLTTGQVAALFGVDPATVSRWALEGRIASVRTRAGKYGHRRYRESEMLALRQEDQANVPPA